MCKISKRRMFYNVALLSIWLSVGLCLRPEEQKKLEERRKLLILQYQNWKSMKAIVSPDPNRNRYLWYNQSSENQFDRQTASFITDLEFRQNDNQEDSPKCKDAKGEVASTTANMFYFRTCPEVKYVNFGEPCVEDHSSWRKDSSKYSDKETDENGKVTMYHYWYQKNVKNDTLYDMYPTYKKTGRIGKTLRLHTCINAKPLWNVYVSSYGLGWAYIVWNTPRENCFVKYGYNYKYYAMSHPKLVFETENAGETEVDPGWFNHHKVVVCPTYPNDFCVIISENVVPYQTMVFKVMYYRFGGDDQDKSDWTEITFQTDDNGMEWKYCPPLNILESLWFAIFLGVLLGMLLVAAGLLAVLLDKLKRRQDLKKDPDWYEEEKIPPRSAMHQVWERLRNFFKELCPRPQPPPPPPPPPPPSARKSLRMERRKSRRESKLKKIKPKPTLPPPEPKPPPPPPPRRRRKPPPPPVPPPVPPRRTRKPRREMKGTDEGRKSIVTSYLDTKKAASAVGGTGRRPRPRRR